jgi:hypothetical protein
MERQFFHKLPEGLEADGDPSIMTTGIEIKTQNNIKSS